VTGTSQHDGMTITRAADGSISVDGVPSSGVLPATVDRPKGAVKIERITRSTFLYFDSKPPKSKFAQCATCVHFLRREERCELHGPDDDVDDDDSCGLYVHGEALGVHPLSLVTPEQSGLVSRQVRCENCRFFDPDDEPRVHCDLYTQLNRMLPALFELDRYVQAKGCCNAQTPGKRNPAVFKPLGPLADDSGEDAV